MLKLSLVQIIQRVTVPFCCFCVWTLMALFLWSLWVATRDGVKRLKRLHQIPCAHCQFFTGNYCLKCTVHPSIALSEAAIDCPDYQPTSPTVISTQSHYQRKQTSSRVNATVSLAAITSTISCRKFYDDF